MVVVFLRVRPFPSQIFGSIVDKRRERYRSSRIVSLLYYKDCKSTNAWYVYVNDLKEYTLTLLKEVLK
jgi:hypothetical protein